METEEPNPYGLVNVLALKREMGSASKWVKGAKLGAMRKWRGVFSKQAFAELHLSRQALMLLLMLPKHNQIPELPVLTPPHVQCWRDWRSKLPLGESPVQQDDDAHQVYLARSLVMAYQKNFAVHREGRKLFCYHPSRAPPRRQARISLLTLKQFHRHLLPRCVRQPQENQLNQRQQLDYARMSGLPLERAFGEDRPRWCRLLFVGNWPDYPCEMTDCSSHPSRKNHEVPVGCWLPNQPNVVSWAAAESFAARLVVLQVEAPTEHVSLKTNHSR